MKAEVARKAMKNLKWFRKLDPKTQDQAVRRAVRMQNKEERFVDDYRAQWLKKSVDMFFHSLGGKELPSDVIGECTRLMCWAFKAGWYSSMLCEITSTMIEQQGSDKTTMEKCIQASSDAFSKELPKLEKTWNHPLWDETEDEHPDGE